MTNIHPLILTLRLDSKNQSFFDQQRTTYFPAELNHLHAHLTLFHHLLDQPHTIAILNAVQQPPFTIDVTGFKFLGNGLAYKIESLALIDLRNLLAAKFQNDLISQDRQGYRPHITIQNKVPSDQAKQLLSTLSTDFQSFTSEALGLDLWRYLGGPWQHHTFFPFHQ